MRCHGQDIAAFGIQQNQSTRMIVKQLIDFLLQAQVQAQADMINAVVAAKPPSDTGAQVTSQLFLLRMFEVLKQAKFDPQSGMLFLPAEMVEAWKKVRDMAEGPQSAPPAPGGQTTTGKSGP